MSLTRKWSLLAAVLVVAIFAAGWFLLIAPKRTEASDLKAQAASQEQANAALVQKLAELKAQQAELPQQRAKLAVFRTQIPDNPALPSLVRSLTAAGRQVGAHIDELSPATPVPVVDPTAPIAAPVTSAGGSGTEAATGTTEASSGTTAAAPTPAAPTALLYEVPLRVTVSGSYFELEQFVNKLEKLKRSFLVSGFTVEPLDDADVPAGSLQIIIDGKVFLAPEVVATATTPTPVTATSK